MSYDGRSITEAHRSANAERDANVKLPLGERPKRCRRCKKWKSLDEFGSDRRQSAGKAKDCKACVNARKAWRYRNDPSARVYARSYYERHRSSSTKPRSKKAVSTSTGRSAWQLRREAATVERVERLVVLELDDGVCYLCGEDVDPLKFHLDHVWPLVEGGVHAYSNVRVVHPSCNGRKKRSTPEPVAL